MDIYQVNSYAEKVLQQKADQNKIPLGGAIELLPLCNMNCKMCYIRLSKQEMDKQGRLLSCDEWLHLVKEATKEGLLFLLLTGGEPLLYPDFKRLYIELCNLGIILTINTNATLINEEWAKFFSKYGCRRINITLYGKDDNTYNKLCNNPNGFTQVINACKLLKKHNVPFRFTCSLTPLNVNQIQELHHIAAQFDVPLKIATYMFPPARKSTAPEKTFRLCAEEAAQAMLYNYQLEFPDVDFKKAAINNLSHLSEPIPNHIGFPCHAGHSGFWINWKGELMACGIFNEPKINLLKHSFKEGWEYIVNTTQKMHFCDECKTCKLHNICHVCPAACYTETGKIDQKPEYVCRMAMEQVRLLEKIVLDESDF